MNRIKASWKREWMIGSLLLVAFLAAPALAAEKYPSKPVTYVCQWPPGGQTDTVVRIVAPVLEKNLGQPVTVVNKAGASGYIGFKSVATSKPDGYTIGMLGTGFLLLQYTGDNKISTDEFTIIAQVYSSDSFVTVNAESPFKTIDELIDYARKNPGKLKHGNSAYGSSSQVSSEGFAKVAGFKITQIPYDGFAPAIIALASKEVDFSIAPMAAIRSLLDAGKLKILAAVAEKRSPQLPNIPTLKEKGVNWMMTAFEGIVGPLGMPQEVVDVLDRAVEKTLNDPGLKASYTKMDMLPYYRNRKDYKAYVDQQDQIFKDILKSIGLMKN